MNIDNGHSLVDILRKGLKIQGIPIKLMQTKPTLAGEDSALHQLYLANRFAVVRQMRYSLDKADRRCIPAFQCGFNQSSGAGRLCHKLSVA